MNHCAAFTKTNLSVFIGMCMLLTACSDRGTQADTGIYTIDFEQCINTEKAMMLSEIADTIEYLELKTPKDIIITRIKDIIPVDDFLFIGSRSGIFKFTRQGEFVKEIGRGGQGPGEYSMVFNIDIDPVKQEMVILDNGQVLFYDLDGNYLRTGKWGDIHLRIAVSDSVLWISTFALHVDEFIAFALNHRGETIASMPNPIYGMESLNEGIAGSLSKSLKNFYHYNGSLFLKGMAGNDSIFQLSGINREPYAFIHIGKYKLPHEYEPWYFYDAFEKNGSRYWGVPAVNEDDRYLYLHAQRYQSLDGPDAGPNKDDNKYIVYDKEKRKGFATRDKQERKLTDDILGGPPFWPHWVSDDYYMNVIEAYDLRGEVEKGKYTLNPALEKQLAGFDYGTNELIILCRRKK